MSLNKKIVLDAEKSLSGNTTQNPILLVSIINGTEVLALFYNMEDARKYLLRISINFCLNYEESVEDWKKYNGDSWEIPTFEKYVKEHMDEDEYYEFHPISHLNIHEPIYVLQNYNYHVHGEPTDYLTNSLEKFIETQGGRNKFTDEAFGMKNNRFSDDWLKKCTLKVNPSLPEIEWETIDNHY